MSETEQPAFAPIETPWDHLAVETAVDEAIASGRTRIRKSSMKIGSYNGFTADVRLIADRKIKVAQELGLIPRAAKCSVCDQQEGRIDYHAEDYSQPLLVAPICQKCHLALHNRVRSPGFRASWGRLVAAHGNGTKWFEHLDPIQTAENQAPRAD